MHDRCRLGKWYYGFEGGSLLNYYSFRSLEAPHKEVRTAESHSALNYFAAGDMNAMSQELGRMERSVIGWLTSWKSGCRFIKKKPHCEVISYYRITNWSHHQQD